MSNSAGDGRPAASAACQSLPAEVLSAEGANSSSLSRASRCPAGTTADAASDTASVALAAVPAERLCGVCGDRSLGYNFGIISCESCKAFFRRSALKQKTDRCLFAGNCTVTVHTRRFCSSCRLNKCFAVGMRKDMILDEEEKRRRKQIILLNRELKLLQRCEHANAALPIGAQSMNSSVLHAPRTAADDVSSCEVARPAHLPNSSNDFRQPVALGTTPGGQQQSPLAGAVSSSSSCCRCCCCCRRRRHDVLDPVPPVLRENIGLLLTDAALRLQRQLAGSKQEEIAALACGYTSTLGLDAAEETTEPWPSVSRDYFVQRTGHLAGQFVRFARLVPDFRHFPAAVQACLLTAGGLGGLTLRSAEVYDPSRGRWSVGCGAVTADALNTVGLDEHRDYYEQHVTLICGLRRLLPIDARGRCDPIVIALLQAVMLLSPEHAFGTAADNRGSAAQRSSPVATAAASGSGHTGDDSETRLVAAVSDAQLHYVGLLRCHLEATYSYELAADLLPSLLQLLTVCKFYARRHGRVILLVNGRDESR